MPVPTIAVSFLARVLYFLTVLNSLLEKLFQSATEDVFPSAQMKFTSIQFGSSSSEHLKASPFFSFSSVHTQPQEELLRHLESQWEKRAEGEKEDLR